MTDPAAKAQDPLLITIVGPTASGKTSLAVRLAEKFNCEIISCDSVAVYRELEIGTAKPTREERQRVPHHLIDVAAPDQPYSAGDYSREARAALRDIHARHRIAIVAGGTGLYLRAFVEGLFPGPQRSETLRQRLRASEDRRGKGHLHRLLARIDPAAAATIHSNDQPKLIRAIEVCIAARQPFSEGLKKGRDPLTGVRILRIGLDPDRAQLYQRINQRATAMFAHGLVEETRGLLEKYGPDCRPLQSLGYKQASALLRGELDLPQAIASAAQGHRNYAKRQMSWFRADPEIHWLREFGDAPDSFPAACALVGEQAIAEIRTAEG